MPETSQLPALLKLKNRLSTTDFTELLDVLKAVCNKLDDEVGYAFVKGLIADPWIGSQQWPHCHYITLQLRIWLAKRGDEEALQTTSLNLARGKLHSLPVGLSIFQNLQELDLQGNPLTELPEEIGELKNLEVLSISFSKVTSLPSSIGRLTKLEQFEALGCKLKSLPSGLVALTIDLLQWKDLGGDVCRQTDLRVLEIIHPNPDNRFPYINMSIPLEIGQLKKLTRLSINNCILQPLPDAFFTLTQLQELELEHCGLNQISKQFARFSSLVSLNVNNNPFTAFPAILQHLPKLQTIGLQATSLTVIPDIPEAFLLPEIRKSGKVDWPVDILLSKGPLQVQLRKLQLEALVTKGKQDPSLFHKALTLHLTSWHLPELPESLQQFGNMKKLDLSGNQLTSIPAFLLQSATLKEINLSSNPLQEVPSALFDMPSLEKLNLSLTKISSLPEDWEQRCRQSSLRRLDLRNTPLSYARTGDKRQQIGKTVVVWK